MPECGNPAKSEEPVANNLPHEIRIACDTDTLALLTLAKARLIHHLRTEPSNRVVLCALAKVFLEDDSQNRVGTMFTRMRIEHGPDVRCFRADPNCPWIASVPADDLAALYCILRPRWVRDRLGEKGWSPACRPGLKLGGHLDRDRFVAHEYSVRHEVVRRRDPQVVDLEVTHEDLEARDGHPGSR